MKRMSAFAFGLFGAVTLANAALAQPAGNPERGRQIVLQGGQGLQACAACHGQHGAGQDQSGFPRLAGVNPEYLLKQIQNFKTGQRQNPVMQPIAKALSDQDARDALAYYANQNLHLTPRPYGKDPDFKLGEKLVLNGNWDKKIPACISCHGPQALGVGVNFPRLAGQQPTYIINQIENWKKGARKNDPQGLMRVIAERLSPAETQAAAHYLSSIQPGMLPPSQAAQEGGAPAAGKPATQGAAR